MFAFILQAVGLFIVTNIDDIIVLALFFARGAGRPGTTTRIIAGQYLGFGAILVASIVIAIGANSFLPESIIPYFGLIPLALGLRAAWKGWRGEAVDDDDDEELITGKPISVTSVAAVTFANGGDNVGVYVPVFVTVGASGIVAYSGIFLLLIAALVLAARFVATRKYIAVTLERWEHVLFPIVLIGLGMFILVEGGAFSI